MGRTRWMTHRMAVAGRLLAALSVLAAGCTSVPLDARKDQEFHDRTYTASRPVVRPTRALTSFTDSLGCMDRLLRASNLPTTLVTSKQFPDPSGKVPAATKDMIVTALSQMSRLSNAFRYVDFEVDIVRQDTVQNLTTILLNNNQIQLQRPAIYMSGAISYFDQSVASNRFDLGTSAERLDTGYSRSRSTSVMGLEMHLGDFRTRTLMPGLDSANEVVIGSAGQGLDLAGRISRYGVRFNVGRDYVLGIGGALRTLVDLAVIELVGKWARVPYWQCLTLEQSHPEFQRLMRDWYEDGSALANNQLVQRSLIAQGYLAPERLEASPDDPQFIEALGRFQADQGIVVSGIVDFPTYERALRGFVTLGPDGQMQQVGWGSGGGAKTVRTRTVPGTAVAAPTLGGTPTPRGIDLQLENPLVGRNAFEVGEQVFISAALNRASYLYCFFQDAQGRVMRALPNPTNPNALVTGNVTLRIPDWMGHLPGFVLDTTAPGTERLGCFASGRDLAGALGALMSTPAFQPIEGATGLPAISSAMQAAAGGSDLGSASLEWQVAPRRVAAPAPGAPSAPRQ